MSQLRPASHLNVSIRRDKDDGSLQELQLHAQIRFKEFPENAHNRLRGRLPEDLMSDEFLQTG